MLELLLHPHIIKEKKGSIYFPLSLSPIIIDNNIKLTFFLFSDLSKHSQHEKIEERS